MFCTAEKFPFITDVFTTEDFKDEDGIKDLEQLLTRGLVSQSIKETVTKDNIDKFNVVMMWNDSYNFDWIIVPKEKE